MAPRCGRRRARRPRWVIRLRVIAHRAAATAPASTRSWAFGRSCGLARRLAHRVMSLQHQRARASLWVYTGKDNKGPSNVVSHAGVKDAFRLCAVLWEPPARPTNTAMDVGYGVGSAASTPQSFQTYSAHSCVMKAVCRHQKTYSTIIIFAFGHYQNH